MIIPFGVASFVWPGRRPKGSAVPFSQPHRGYGVASAKSSRQRLFHHRLATAVICLVSVVILSLSTTPLWAQDPITVIENSYTDEYPEHGFTFHLRAVGAQDITAITLYYQRVQDGSPNAVILDFRPDHSIEIEHTLVTHHQLLVIPFTEVVYWWQVQDATGEQLTTEPWRILTSDDRFDWQELADEGITVHWYRGGDQFGRALLAVSQATLGRLQKDLGVQVQQPIHMYVYATLTETGDFGRVDGEEWLGQEQTVAPNLAFAVIPPRGRGYAMMRSLSAHQVTRLALTQTVADAPHWLVEGLAVGYEERPAPDYFQALSQALRGRRVIPLEALCQSWDPAALRYGESASVVLYIRDEYGPEAITDLLAAYRDGASCQEGVQAVLGVTLEQLQTQWEASLQGELDLWTRVQNAFRYNPLVISAVGFAIAIALVLATHYVSRIGVRSER